MPSDSDWDWFVEPISPSTITVHEEEVEEIAVLYGADGEIIRRYTNARKQPMGFALTPVKRKRRRHNGNDRTHPDLH
jgi:hypothetical protein